MRLAFQLSLKVHDRAKRQCNKNSSYDGYHARQHEAVVQQILADSRGPRLVEGNGRQQCAVGWQEENAFCL
jgi:hypothetical protein